MEKECNNKTVYKELNKFIKIRENNLKKVMLYFK